MVKKILKFLIFFFSYLGIYYILGVNDDQKLIQGIIAAVVSVVFFLIMSAANTDTIFERKREEASHSDHEI